MHFLRQLLPLKFNGSNPVYIFRAAIPLFLKWLMVGAAGCQPSRSRITPIIQNLHSPHIEVRDSASVELSALAKSHLTVEESIEALEAAAGAFPPRPISKGDIGEVLILAVVPDPRSEYVPVIRRLFERYSPGAREAALILMGKLQDTASVAATVDLIIEIGTGINARGTDTTQFGADQMIEPIAYGILLDHLRAERIAASQLSRLEPVIIAASRRYASIVAPLQRVDGASWMWEDGYLDPRDNAGYLLDILGYIRSQEATRELTEALAYTDPYLKYFAVTSLLRHEFVAPADEFNQVARNSYTRISLYSTLQTARRLDLFPRTYETQPALAESDMVRWLVYPTELGRAPDSIEQMAIRSVNTPEGIKDYYFYRFRTNPPHWAADMGWLAGIAGPFLRSDTPTAESDGYTFSEFKPWTDSFPDEYMKANE
jgi:hypothetical protein